MKRSGLPWKVRCEAIKEVKEAIKKAGGKISHFSPREILKVADELLAIPKERKRIVAKAKRSLAND